MSIDVTRLDCVRIVGPPARALATAKRAIKAIFAKRGQVLRDRAATEAGFSFRYERGISLHVEDGWIVIFDSDPSRKEVWAAAVSRALGSTGVSMIGSADFGSLDVVRYESGRKKGKLLAGARARTLARKIGLPKPKGIDARSPKGTVFLDLGPSTNVAKRTLYPDAARWQGATVSFDFVDASTAAPLIPLSPPPPFAFSEAVLAARARSQSVLGPTAAELAEIESFADDALRTSPDEVLAMLDAEAMMIRFRGPARATARVKAAPKKPRKR